MMLIGLFFMPLAPAMAEEKPIPQDPEKLANQLRDSLAWHRRTLGDAYDKIGRKDPRWDAAARAALDLAARHYSMDGDKPIMGKDVYAAAKVAVDAGCDDPMIGYLYSWMAPWPKGSAPTEQWQRYHDAVAALEKSEYPPSRRARTLIFYASSTLARKEATADDRKEAARMLDVGVGLFPKVATQEKRHAGLDRVWYEMSQVSTKTYRIINGGDFQAAFDKVDAAMAQSPELKVARLLAKGDFMMRYAWDARGTGLADTITEDGGKKFDERLVEAGKALTEAWEAQNDCSQAATLMLSIVKGGSGNREEMEKWFQRAMEADGNNYVACTEKMDFLEPKWHGSPEEMMEFGKACRDTKNWRAGIPMLIVDVYSTQGRKGTPEEKNKYFTDKQVREDIKTVFEDYLLHFPDNTAVRSRYAGFCAYCQRVADAHRQFQLLGDDLVPSKEFTEAWLKKVREMARQKVMESKIGEVPSPPL